MGRTTFAVIADSHFHAEHPGGGAQHGYASDASFNVRNRAVAQTVAASAAAFVVHLGDMSHPVPGLAAHHLALDEAQRTWDLLGKPFHVVPGNHDVGDKRHPWAPAPGVSPAHHDVFSQRWGPPWWSMQRAGLHLVGIDTPVIGSGLALEDAQWAWLEADLAAATNPIVAFLHYPPFLLHPDEDEHYDNLAEPGRGRLLELFARYRVAAAFCGHVHHPFLLRHRGTDWYLLPSTAFVRPGFAELVPVAPDPQGRDDEHGRNDRGRLGFCYVHIDDGPDGPQIDVEWVRTEGATTLRAWAPGLTPGSSAQPPCPVALTLRHAWDTVSTVPADNLDPYRRKRARNDLTLLAAMQLSVATLRLPLEDLRRADTRARLLGLCGQGGCSEGTRVVLLTAQPLDDQDRVLLAQHRDVIVALEYVAPRHLLGDLPRDLPVPLWCSVVGARAARDDAYFSHFPTAGFRTDETGLDAIQADGLVFRVPDGQAPLQAVAQIATAAGGRTAVAQVWLPRAGEGTAFTDDLAVARRVAETVLAARAYPTVQVQLDSFVDHDRGYFPRHGLIDRRGDPRPAWWVLRNLVRLVEAGVRVTQRSDDVIDVAGLGAVHLAGGPAGIDLVTGDFVTTPTLAPVFLTDS